MACGKCRKVFSSVYTYTELIRSVSLRNRLGGGAAGPLIISNQQNQPRQPAAIHLKKFKCVEWPLIHFQPVS